MKMRLKRSFFVRPTLRVAKDLLGKYLVRKIRLRPTHQGGELPLRGKLSPPDPPAWRAPEKLVGKIVETEAYIGPEDRASHAFGGKITDRCKTEYLIGGHIYIYLCYGMYWMLNITTEKAGKPECVLIRALEPVIANWHEFTTNFTNKHSRKFVSKFVKIRNLASGPGKLCQWLKLDKSFDGEDLTKSKRIWLEDYHPPTALPSPPTRPKKEKFKIVAKKRIGVDYAGSWAKKPWRFYIKGNPFVSKG